MQTILRTQQWTKRCEFYSENVILTYERIKHFIDFVWLTFPFIETTHTHTRAQQIDSNNGIRQKSTDRLHLQYQQQQQWINFVTNWVERFPNGSMCFSRWKSICKTPCCFCHTLLCGFIRWLHAESRRVWCWLIRYAISECVCEIIFRNVHPLSNHLSEKKANFSIDLNREREKWRESTRKREWMRT